MSPRLPPPDRDLVERREILNEAGMARALLQYDFAHTTRCLLGSPVNAHVPGSPPSR